MSLNTIQDFIYIFDSSSRLAGGCVFYLSQKCLLEWFELQRQASAANQWKGSQIKDASIAENISRSNSSWRTPLDLSLYLHSEQAVDRPPPKSDIRNSSFFSCSEKRIQCGNNWKCIFRILLQCKCSTKWFFFKSYEMWRTKAKET